MKIIKDQAMSLILEAIGNLKPIKSETREDKSVKINNSKKLLKSAAHLISKL